MTNYQRRVKRSDDRNANAQNADGPEDAQINAILAVAEAVLALAEQQKIANIIAYGDSTSEPGAWDDVIEDGMGLA